MSMFETYLDSRGKMLQDCCWVEFKSRTIWWNVGDTKWKFLGTAITLNSERLKGSHQINNYTYI